MAYTVLLRPEAEGGFSVLVPALPGCFSQGDTVLDALANAREAIECYLGSLMDDGEDIPVEGESITVPTQNLEHALIFRVSVGGEKALAA
jgi:antitoxin HicB